MKRKSLIKILSTLIAVVIPTLSAASHVYSADTIVLQAPKRNRVTDIGYVTHVNTYDWYADLAWDLDGVHFPPGSEERMITLGLNEVVYGTGAMNLDAFRIALPGSAVEHKLTEYSPEGIKNGTIYESYVRASYVETTPTGRITVTSQRSNPAKFLTGLDVSVELIPGTNNIKIKWDDVWDTNGRINYRILISDTKGFTQPPPIPDIVASEIGKSDSAVTINTAEKKLEYIYTYAMPGREYSIKVVPLPSPNVACVKAEEIPPVTIKTDILLKAQRVGFTNEGDTIWKLFWNPIVKGTTYTRVEYELYRYVNNDPEGQLFRLIPDIDSYQIIIKKDDPNLYSFKIDAKAYVLGSSAPIEFRSNNKVALKEQIPQQPEAPDLVDAFYNADPEDLIYDDLLTSSKATILWRVPYTGEGYIDTDITYDIYLTEDIQEVSNPPSNRKIASDASMGTVNEVRNILSGEIMGYRYDLDGLKSNSTYYFVIYAKKNYLVPSGEGNTMVTMTYVSKPSVKVIITRPDTGTDRPIAPSSPPFDFIRDSVTLTGAELVMEKRWHALYNDQTKRWEYVTEEQYIDNLLLDDEDENKKEATIVDYPEGWIIVPHVVRYNDALNVIRLRNNRDGEYITYSDLSQPDIKAFEIPQQAFVIPRIEQDEDQTLTFKVSGLEHNTAYLVWITIENQNGNSSDPSDPLIITTTPEVPDWPVVPTVPTDLRGIASDSFVDLSWTFVQNMDYEIKGGTSDFIESASITRQVSYEEIRTNTFIRIDNLSPDTVYYFWIKAISRSGSQVIESQFSNPLVIKTEAFRPPAPPTGFGVKSDGVTESSITYLWDAKDGFTYYFEFSQSINFEDAEMKVVSGGIHTEENLISNRRYYARLYALEDRTGLMSEPTRTIMVVTNKSKGEYDSGYDLDDEVTGDGLKIPVKLEDDVWVITSLGNDAHVLGERIRSHYESVMKLDLSQPPKTVYKIRLEFGAAVFEALSDLKKELYISLPWGQVILQPGSLQTDDYFRLKARSGEPDFVIETISHASQYRPTSDMTFKTPVTDISIGYRSSNIKVERLVHPMRVQLPVGSLSSEENTKAYGYDIYESWYELPTTVDYKSKTVSGELIKPGPVVAAVKGITPKPGIPNYMEQSLKSIQRVHELKSLQNKPFDINARITQKEMLMLILDCIPAQYNQWDFFEKAYAARLIDSVSGSWEVFSRKDEAAHMLVSLYRFKTMEPINPNKPEIWSFYNDMSKVQREYLISYRFALENGIINGNGSNLSNPDKLITYGEFLVMLERTLRLCGDI